MLYEIACMVKLAALILFKLFIHGNEKYNTTYAT